MRTGWVLTLALTLVGTLADDDLKTLLYTLQPYCVSYTPPLLVGTLADDDLKTLSPDFEIFVEGRASTPTPLRPYALTPLRSHAPTPLRLLLCLHIRLSLWLRLPLPQTLT